MSASIAVAIFVLFIWWNVRLPFARDRNPNKKLIPDESKCFSERCGSITYTSEGNTRAVLFIHGYPTAPNMYAYPAKRLHELGYDTYAPLVPTFGADPAENAKTNFSQWFGFVDDYYQDLRRKYGKVYVVGVSMGGAMALKLAEKHSSTPLAPDRIAVLAAPVAYNNPLLGIVTKPSGFFARTLGLFTPTLGWKTVDGRPDGDDGNEEWAGYSGVVIAHYISLQKAFDQIRKDLSKIQVPIFLMHDRNDKTVPFRNMAIIAKRCGSWVEVKREVEMKGDFKHSRHSLLMYRSVREGYTEEIASFFGK